MQMAHKLKSFLEYAATSRRGTNTVQLKVSFFGEDVNFLINFAIINVNICIFVLTGLLFFLVSDCPPGMKTDDAQGRCCIFPFMYSGVYYYSCTTVDNGIKPWCSLFDPVYNNQSANCGKKTRLKIPFLKTQERCRSRFTWKCYIDIHSRSSTK